MYTLSSEVLLYLLFHLITVFCVIYLNEDIVVSILFV